MTQVDWHPIESAPKDRPILVWDGAAWPVNWREDCQHGQFETRPGWQIFECEDPFYSIAAFRPTHWAEPVRGPQGDNDAG